MSTPDRLRDDYAPPPVEVPDFSKGDYEDAARVNREQLRTYICGHCGRRVDPDDPGDAGPSCGAHLLHIGCGHRFGCGECKRVRTEDVL